MSLNFSANQFEEEFKPARLRNWEVPKWFPKHPCRNHDKTHVISNERGHLLPGVPRCPLGPWGDFVGTWDLPKTISRRTANKLSAPNKHRIGRWRVHCKTNDMLRTSVTSHVTSPEKSPQSSDSIVTQPGSLQKGAGSSVEEIPKRALCPIHDTVY